MTDSITDGINEIERRAKIILEWCKQQKELPKEERDVLEFRQFDCSDWEEVFEPVWNFSLGEYRLRKRPKTYEVTVYWYRSKDGKVTPSLYTPDLWPYGTLLGTSTDKFTEPQE